MRATLALILALALCLCAFAPVLAEEPAMQGNMYLTGERIVKEPVTYRLLYQSQQATLPHVDPNEMPYYVDVAERTGVNMVFEGVPREIGPERLATTFASGDLPDVFINIITDNDKLTYGPVGALLGVNDYLEYMPLFTDLLENEPLSKAIITCPDGNIYTIPQINMWSTWPGDGVYIASQAFVNGKWLDQLGMDVPETTDEFADYLRGVRDNDMNGNGDPNDEIPLGFLYNNGNDSAEALLYCPFGIIGNAKHKNVQDGRFFYAIQDPRFVDAIKYQRMLYEEGLIDPEAYTMDGNRYNAKGRIEEDIWGVYCSFETGPILYAQKTEGFGGENPYYKVLLPLKGADGSRTWSNQYAGTNANYMAISGTAKNPEILCRWADFFYAPDETVQQLWGMEGVGTLKTDEGWTILDARDKTKVGFDPDKDWLTRTTMRTLPSYASNEIVSKLTYYYQDTGETFRKDGDTKYPMSKMVAPYAVEQYYPPLLLSFEANERAAILTTPIENAMVEKELDWIMSRGDVETEWEDFIKRLNAMGLEELTAIHQEVVDRVYAR
jgi:putative aldouronate transport system substrate-binding protein